MTAVLSPTSPVRSPGSLVKELDLTKADFLALVDRASELKLARRTYTETKGLTGRNIALIFEKASTRTHCAFEVAAHEQGAQVTYLGPEGSHLGSSESIRDTARVLGRMFDGIAFRGFGQDAVEQLADSAGVPVWNGLTDQWHPTQMLADVLTMSEHSACPLEQITYCFLGDGHSNVARSLLITGALLGMDVRIVAPRSLWPAADVVAAARRLALDSGARILVTEDVARGTRDAEFVYTDVWVSMGEDSVEWAQRIPLLRPYRVTSDVMAGTGRTDSRFLHCLPSLHDAETDLGRRLLAEFGLVGAEVSDSVFESEQSLVFEQAENRLHTIKALLVAALAP